MRSSRSRSHSLVRLSEADGLGDVNGVEVVLLVSGAADVPLGDGLGKRPSNEAAKENKFSLSLRSVKRRNSGVPWLLPLGVDEEGEACLDCCKEDE